MLATCFSTALALTNSVEAIPLLERPSAISLSTSRSRSESDATRSRFSLRGRSTSRLASSGSMTISPSAMRVSVSERTSTLPTFSLRR